MDIDWMPTDVRKLKEYYALSQALLDQVRKVPIDSPAVLTGVETYVDPATGDVLGTAVVNKPVFFAACIKIAERLSEMMGEEAFTQWATKFRDATPQERAVMLEQEEV